MAKIRSKNTRPEMVVRRLTHALGFRYRLHRRDLPGSPDIVFGPRRKVIFVHGCFWHGHECKRGARQPRANSDYWRQKIGRNRARDADAQAALADGGWDSMIIWECETRDSHLAERIRSFLSDGNGTKNVG